MSNKSMIHARKVFKAQRRYDRRDGYNRGIRAAARLALEAWVFGQEAREQSEWTSEAILKLLKPTTHNPGVRVKA